MLFINKDVMLQSELHTKFVFVRFYYVYPRTQGKLHNVLLSHIMQFIYKMHYYYRLKLYVPTLIMCTYIKIGAL